MGGQLTKLGLVAVATNSALAIYSSWGDVSSVAFVLLADAAALALLFLCLRAFERGGGGREDAMTKAAAVWALETLLTATVAPGAAPAIVQLAVGALVFVCLRDVDRQVRGGRVDMDAQYCALAKAGLAALTCSVALDAYDTRRDRSSAASVLVSYAVLVVLTGLFVRAVARGHAGDGDHGQG